MKRMRSTILLYLSILIPVVILTWGFSGEDYRVRNIEAGICAVSLLLGALLAGQLIGLVGQLILNKVNWEKPPSRNEQTTGAHRSEVSIYLWALFVGAIVFYMVALPVVLLSGPGEFGRSGGLIILSSIFGIYHPIMLITTLMGHWLIGTRIIASSVFGAALFGAGIYASSVGVIAMYSANTSLLEFLVFAVPVGASSWGTYQLLWNRSASLVR